MYYMYRLSTEADRDEYYKYKKELIKVPEFEFAEEEFDNEDESLFQFFNVKGERQFLLKCDEWVGAVYVQSKILLDEFYKFPYEHKQFEYDVKW